jgi:glucose/arabinose dehydrogenase
MNAVLPGLYASPPQTLPCAPSLEIRAFVLQREQGNLLVYGAAETPSVDEPGGVSRWYLNHRHEAGFGCHVPAAQLYVHERDRDAVADTCNVHETFSERGRVGGDSR